MGGKVACSVCDCVQTASCLACYGQEEKGEGSVVLLLGGTNSNNRELKVGINE